MASKLKGIHINITVRFLIASSIIRRYFQVSLNADIYMIKLALEEFSRKKLCFLIGKKIEII